ncbi:hypothetical protein AB3X96_18030 [Paraburkholderia sp. BR13439]|uniref:hypothetical protein n=1 Tax=Paraburkholderia sp. BR13439 TaxID=3236996 RepID=UPI0034CF83B6
MGLNKRNTGAAEPKDPAETSTFFGAGKPAAPQEGPKPAVQAPTSAARQEPAGTFFSNRYTDPLTELSTHRARGWSAMSERERAARKQAEEERARTGLERLMSFMKR